MTGPLPYETPWRGRDGLVHLTYSVMAPDIRSSAMTICSYRSQVDGSLAPEEIPSCFWCLTHKKAEHR